MIVLILLLLSAYSTPSFAWGKAATSPWTSLFERIDTSLLGGRQAILPKRSSTPSMELGDFTYIAGVLVVLLTVFVFGWLVVWRVVLSQFPQFREALKDIFGLGDNEQKKKARELRRQRRDSRSEQRKGTAHSEGVARSCIQGETTCSSCKFQYECVFKQEEGLSSTLLFGLFGGLSLHRSF